jgi:hypothetical protein
LCFQAEKSRAIKFGRNLGDFSSKRTDIASIQNFNLSTKRSEWPELRRVLPEKKPFQISNRASVSEDIKLGSVSDPNSMLETASFIKCCQSGGSTDQHHRLTLGCVNTEIEGPLCLTGPANLFARRLQRLQSGKGRILSRRGRLADHFRRTQSLISPPLRSFVEVAREAMESGKKTMEGHVGGWGVGAGRGGVRAGRRHHGGRHHGDGFGYMGDGGGFGFHCDGACRVRLQWWLLQPELWSICSGVSGISGLSSKDDNNENNNDDLPEKDVHISDASNADPLAYGTSSMG